MMDLLLATSGGEAQAASGGYVDDVFSAYTYTGNGSTQTINNGIDLAGKGGLVWVAARSSAFGHYLYDTIRGLPNRLSTHSANAQASTTPAFISSFNSDGFSTQNDSTSTGLQTNNLTGVAWTFRKTPKFFDVVTYTGNGVSGRQIPHSLGAAPGMVIVKQTDGASNWSVYHVEPGVTKYLLLNSTSGETLDSASGLWANTAQNTTHLVIGDSGQVNGVGKNYVAYLFAHDPSADGIIQCGSFTTDGSGNATVNLGWEPQFLITKQTNASGGPWHIHDTIRGMTTDGATSQLYADQATAEGSGNVIQLQATGFKKINAAASSTHIYLAIRRPNKLPTSGTEVYSSSTASGVVSAGFPVDLHIGATRTGAASNHAMHARLTGGTKELVTGATAAEATITDIGFDSMTGLKASLPSGMVNHFFRRTTGFFDVVCDTGIGVAHAIAHNLTKAPELIIRKSRSAATQWEVWHSALAATEKLVLNSDAAKATDATAWGSTLPTATQFTVGAGANVNANAATFVTYLFATLAGISKCGSYTGNGSSQTINCGFATGARFILIKRTDATGDWYVWDSVRGIVAANDPHLSLNTTAAEVTTDDSVDPNASGFIVNQNTATNINVNGGQYIFLAIA